MLKYIYTGNNVKRLVRPLHKLFYRGIKALYVNIMQEMRFFQERHETTLACTVIKYRTNTLKPLRINNSGWNLQPPFHRVPHFISHS